VTPRGTEALDVVVVGDVMTDVVAVMSRGLARGSDTPSTIATYGGGSGANVAAWLAHQAVPTTYVGRVGRDPFGRTAVEQLQTSGVSVWVTEADEAATGTCVVLVEPGGERSMLPDTGANATLLPADLPPTAFRAGGHLHLSGYVLLNAGSRDAGLAALDLAASARMTVSIDPSSGALLRAVGPERFLEWTRGADLVFANAEEAGLLAGTGEPHAAAARLADTYREVVVKIGPDGALWQAGFITASAPAERGVAVVDTTGAGDAFAAGFLASWLLHPEPESALAAGNRLAGTVVSQPGARPAPPPAH
jgi:sugar/nucleoside kinase (ribokinase family)